MVNQSKLKQISLSSPEYPTEWKSLKHAPKTLWFTGNIHLLQKRKLTAVGSRRTPAHAIKIGTEIVKDVSQAFVIVTGVADGGDVAAIEGALAGGGEVVCVLAGGFSVLPQNNLPLLRKVAKQGLIISLHPFDTPVRAYSYEYRNKLLAMLGEGTLVLGAGEKSGALITAKYAMEQNKPVFALPYPPKSGVGDGCNSLIKKGARLTETALDVLEAFGLQMPTPSKAVSLTQEERSLFQALQERGEAHISELATAINIPVYKVMALLSSLEVKGLTVAMGGNRYAAI